MLIGNSIYQLNSSSVYKYTCTSITDKQTSVPYTWLQGGLLWGLVLYTKVGTFMEVSSVDGSTASVATHQCCALSLCVYIATINWSGRAGITWHHVTSQNTCIVSGEYPTCSRWEVMSEVKDWVPHTITKLRPLPGGGISLFTTSPSTLPKCTLSPYLMMDTSLQI